jgi:hypothetical protein
MKSLKAVLIALIAVCTFSAAQAQERFQTGDRYHRYHHKVVVVRHNRHWHRYDDRRY